MPAEGFIQRHFANLRHIRESFRIDPRAESGTGQIAPFLSRVVGLVHPAFPGSFTFADPVVQDPSSPAAGAGIDITVPPNESWRLRAMRFILTTDANAADRLVRMLFDNGTVAFFGVSGVAVQAASLVRAYNFGAELGYEKNDAVVDFIQGLPTMFFDPGWRIRITVNNLQVGDQISSIGLVTDVFPR